MADEKKTVQDVKKSAEKAAEKAVTEAKKEVAKVSEEVKPAVEKAKAGVKSAQKKATKAAVKAKDSVKRAAEKAVGAEAAPIVYVQYQGDEENVEDLVAAAKASFAAEHARVKVTELKLYIKPEERAAYYVVNDKFAGRVDF